MKIFVIWNVKKKHLMTAKLCNLFYLFIFYFTFFLHSVKRIPPFQYNFSLLYFNILPFPFYGYKWFNMYLCIWFYCIYLSSKLDELCFKFPFFCTLLPSFSHHMQFYFSYELNQIQWQSSKNRTSQRKHTSSIST